MYPIFVEASGNITEAALSPTGKEQVTMKRIRKKFRDMKYRHKLTILLVTSSLVPMTMLALYSHNSCLLYTSQTIRKYCLTILSAMRSG